MATNQSWLVMCWNELVMYSLDCSYYNRSFDTIDKLVNDVVQSGMDPNYEITYNGKPTGEEVIELIVF